VVIGLLPLLACATAIYFVAQWWGGWVLGRLHFGVVGPELPTTMATAWSLLRELISVVESLVSAVRGADYHDWQTWMFLYLLMCLTIRSAPFPGTLRGSLGAIVVLGVGGALASTLLDAADPRLQNAWAVLNLTVAALLLLLMVTLLVRGLVGLIRTLAQGEHSRQTAGASGRRN
jgi:hypothetical protein